MNFRGRWERGGEEGEGGARRAGAVNPSTLQPFNPSTRPLFHCSTVPLFHCSTVPLFHSSTLPLFHSSTVPLFNSSTLQLFNSSTLQLFNSSTLQRFNASTLQLFNSSTLQLFNLEEGRWWRKLFLFFEEGWNCLLVFGGGAGRTITLLLWSVARKCCSRQVSPYVA